jgi:phospholipid/cholesterol/gamma-HCH transport system permease protein
MTLAASSTLLDWDDSSGPARLALRGDWTLANYAALGEAIRRVPASARRPDQVDFEGLRALDTAGAARLLELLGVETVRRIADSGSGLSPERRALLASVANAMQASTAQAHPPRESALRELLAHVGLTVHDTARNVVALLGFTGLTLEALARVIVRPKRLRVTAIVAQIERTGLDAVPIIALLTFMVGAVIAFLGASILADFGATIYTVNLVTFSFLREFAVLLTAILMAGRTASAFTAQIGSMKSNEEIDAMRTLGLSPVDLLVVPRVIALLVSLPILTLVGMASGIFGGALVCAITLDISPAQFFAIFREDIPLRHFTLGISKAPLFAFVIAVIGCLEGFKVRGSAESVGLHTTSSVVQSIFVVIMLDAFAAMFFTEMGW